MPDTLIQAKQIKGLVPAIEKKVIDQPFVVDGKNFMVDLEGPYSAFSGLMAGYDYFTNTKAIQSFRIGNDVFYGTNYGIFKIHINGLIYPVFTFPAVTDTMPWSYTKGPVGGKWYFCRKGVGVVQYDPTGNTKWQIITDSNFPAMPVACCRSYGRLVVLGLTDKFTWSNLDDGTSNTPSLITGAGFQGLSLIGATAGYMLHEVIDGFLVMCDRGIIKSQITDVSPTFTHSIYTGTEIPISPWCSIETDELFVVFQTNKGLFTTTGQHHVMYDGSLTGIKPLDQLWNEFLVRKVYPFVDLTNQTLFRLTYSRDKKWLFLSQSDSNNPTLYNTNYGYNTTRAEWGVLNTTVSNIIDLFLTSGPYLGFNAGYIDGLGNVHFWEELPYVEGPPDFTMFFNYQPPFEMPTHYEGGNLIFASLFNITANNISLLANSVAGLYKAVETTLPYEPTPILSDQSPYTPASTNYSVEDFMTSANPNEDWLTFLPDPTFDDWMVGDYGVCFGSEFDMASSWGYQRSAAGTQNLMGLNAQIDVGLYRLNDQHNVDALAMLQELSVGMFPSAGVVIFEDWLALSGGVAGPDTTEDWNAISAISEDWGVAAPDAVTYQIFDVGTNDGDTVEGITIPSLVNDVGSIQFYAGGETAIFHRIRLLAQNQGEAFHLKFLEMSLNSAGQLN